MIDTNRRLFGMFTKRAPSSLAQKNFQSRKKLVRVCEHRSASGGKKFSFEQSADIDVVIIHRREWIKLQPIVVFKNDYLKSE